MRANTAASTTQLVDLIAQATAQEIKRRAQNTSDPGVLTTRAAYAPERPPSQGDPADVT
jgi:hypothetical protein